MSDWILTDSGFDRESIPFFGNKYMTGNGYMGIRGTLEEFTKDELACVNLAGVYDRVKEIKEPVNAPNGCYGYIVIDGVKTTLQDEAPTEHEVSLDYRYGIFTRKTTWNTKRGNVTLKTERFVSMDDLHVCAIKTEISADFHADINYVFGIDANVWDLNGPHLDMIRIDANGILKLSATTHEEKKQIFVAQTYEADFPHNENDIYEHNKCLRSINFVTDIGVTYTLCRYTSLFTEQDCKDAKEKCISVLNKTKQSGYDNLLVNSMKKWDKIWRVSEIDIEGDDDAKTAINYSLYHLNIIAPRQEGTLSIPARGLSGQTYKGAIFWDTEMFILDYFLMTQPEIAKKLLMYRVETLDGAKKKAAHYGYKGAFYAWESQQGGFDACSDYNITDVFTKRPMRTYFKDKQVHISAAVVYGIKKYIEATGDNNILFEGGLETVIECANFYYDLLLKKADGDKYYINDVIGPDEYHERVNNNAYTNRMAKFVFDYALKCIGLISCIKSADSESRKLCKKLKAEFDLDKLIKDYQDASSNIYIPKPNENKVIEQFDGYFKLEDATVDEVRGRLLDEKEYWGGAYGVASDTQVIKQADVVCMLSMFPEDTDDETKNANLNYYSKRTEHGSSLSACMYSLLSCKCGQVDEAYKMFIKSAKADLLPGGKQWAGLVYIGGTHPAAAGGAYIALTKGFAGVYFENGQIQAKPNLPKNWKKLGFKMYYHEKLFGITVTDNGVTVEEIE